MPDDKTNPKPQPKRKPGRPAAAKPIPISSAPASTCPRCGSTDREAYHNTKELAASGVEHGQPYTHTIWRRCRCRACGQIRIDRTRENRA